MELNVMTFNLRVNVISDGNNAWKYRIQSADQMMKDSESVVIGTQEVLYSMLKDLEEELPNFDWVGEGRFGGQEDEHCAIFYDKTKLKAVKHGTFWLSETPDQPGTISWDAQHPRICTWCDFQCISDPNYQFRVYNTHFDHISEDARIHSAVLLWKQIKLQIHPTLPVVVIGDLNAESDSDAICFLRGEIEINGEKSHLTDVYSVLDNEADMNTGTFHAFTGETNGGPIDYIFTSQDVTILYSTVDQRKMINRYPSDHFPVKARVRLPII